MGSNAFICALPGCGKSCFQEGDVVHECCGRSHAEKMMWTRRGVGAGRQLGASQPTSQKKGSGKAPGLHNPSNSKDTFSTIFGRSGGGVRGASNARRSTPRSSMEARGGAAAAAGGVKRAKELSGRVGGNRNGGGRSGGRIGMDPWEPFHHFSGAGSGNRAGRDGDGRAGASLLRITDHMVLFWQEPSYFVQWTACSFEVDGVRYCNAEQFMMAWKAIIFGDRETHRQIMATSDPRKQKALGRGTRGFDPAVWDKVGFEVVVQGNLAKFRQNPDFREVLLATGDKILAEASPFDTEWGIGLHVDDPDALVPTKWKGKNKLGKALMHVRLILQSEAHRGGKDGEKMEEEGTRTTLELIGGREGGKNGGKEGKRVEEKEKKGKTEKKEEEEKKHTKEKKQEDKMNYHCCAACLSKGNRVVDDRGASDTEGASSGRKGNGRAGK